MKTTDREVFDKENIFGIGASNTGFAQHFRGESFLNPLVDMQKCGIGIFNVTFEPGCRNHWHIHKDGYQVLLVTAGEGWYQEEGKEAQLLHAGDTIVTHAGVKHWHGATKDSWFSHVAITAGEAVWLEEVSDEQYENL